jgi:ParB family chromosome partitioning protein
MTQPTEKVKFKKYMPALSMNKIEVAESNVRRTRRNSKLEELKASITRFGLIHPVIVIQKGDKYKLIVGQRRYLAFQALGKTTIPALIIGSMNPTGQSVVSFVENIHRRDLPYEDTIAICSMLFTEYGGPKVDRIRRISEELGIPHNTVSKYLSYMLIPSGVRKLVEEDKLTRDQAYRVTDAFFPNKEKIIKIASRITRLTKEERDRALEYGKDKPRAGEEEILEEALKPAPNTFELVIPIELETYDLLTKAAKKRGTDVVNFVKSKIEELMPDLQEELRDK